MKNFEPLDWLILALIVGTFTSLVAQSIAEAYVKGRQAQPEQKAKP